MILLRENRCQFLTGPQDQNNNRISRKCYENLTYSSTPLQTPTLKYCVVLAECGTLAMLFFTLKYFIYV